MNEQFDVLIIGAGLSGIGTACHLARECPDKRVAILERRDAVGGTWDLFRYPGIRSDSDMFSFGYKLRPWNALKVLADGPAIREYIRQTARESGVEKNIRFGLKTTDASWSGEKNCWTVTALHEASGETRTYRAKYLISCAGYYNHDAGFRPKFPGEEQFKGQCVHPQQWPENLDYRGKRVVVIGSGATAVTLVPTMAPDAAKVTMLQRSPSYIFSVPASDRISAVLSRFLPERWVYRLARERNILVQRWLYDASKKWPKLMRRWLLANVRKHVGKDFDMSHFTPKYMPWDERLCAVPDADLFKALKSGKAEVVTDHIETFTENGIRLKSGRELAADIIVTATGLNLRMLGGIELKVDGRAQPTSELMTYKGVLVQNVPNFANIFGYTNAPWTLKSDLAASYLCRLIKHMDKHGISAATPRDAEGCAEEGSILGSLASGYVQRAQGALPRQGKSLPWRVLNHFKRDTAMLVEEPIDDGVLELTAKPAAAQWTAAMLAAA